MGDPTDLRDLLDRLRAGVVGRVRELELVVAAIDANRHILIEGPPGTGKSTLLRGVAREMDIGFEFVEGNAELTPARLIGHFDPARVLSEGYDPDVFVIRHPQVGACRLADGYTDASVVNAGDGTGEHPSQALLDLYTVQREVGPIKGLHVAIVGDVLHSRVARSGIRAFTLMGAKVTVVAPPTLGPRHLAEALGAEVSSDIRDIADADIVYVLRMQLERMGAGGFVPSLDEYARMYQVDHARLRPGQRVMHAGPVNRGVEISGALVDDPETLIEAQATNGVVVRMAVLYDVATGAAGGSAQGDAALEAA